MSKAFELSDSFFSCTRLTSDNETTVQKISTSSPKISRTTGRKFKFNPMIAEREGLLCTLRMHILRTSYASIFFKQLHRIIPVFSTERYLHIASKETFPPKQSKLCVDIVGCAILGHPGKR
ncbi:hypothetical protein BPOR_0016g00340 [Botrytis porri]|uniref:Uncharacterized protein n=1 Tax=Botrytis porri TaxID=87229 RepID=A0A4Z1L5B9_9HELO|nr:hypothetical protein BPOR_0016g00340 [Botrytis porri]